MNITELRTWAYQAAAHPNPSLASKLPIDLLTSLVAHRALVTDREYVLALVAISPHLPEAVSREIRSLAWNYTDIDVSRLPEDPNITYVDETNLDATALTKPFIHIHGQPFPIPKEEVPTLSQLHDQFTLVFADAKHITLSAAVWKNRSEFIKCALNGSFQEAKEKKITLPTITSEQFFGLHGGHLDIAHFIQDFEAASFLASPPLLKRVLEELLPDRINTYEPQDHTIDLDLRTLQFPATHTLKSLLGLPIRSLNLEGQVKISERALCNIGKIETLQELSLRRMKIGTLKELAALKLRSLDISNCDQIAGQEALRPLAAMSSLKVLKINGCTKIKTQALHDLQNLHIQELEMERVSGMGADALTYITPCTALTKLDISHNSQFKTGTIQELQNKLSKLSIIK